VWQTPCIARIRPDNAEVSGWIVLEGLVHRAAAANAAARARMDVLNGIAYDSASGRVFVTGKWWSRLYEIKVVPVPDAQQAAELERSKKLCRPRAQSVFR
jgi:glutaminyl-peptide cyclotransferase